MINLMPKYAAAGILGTVAMTMFLIIAPVIGMPKMAPWELLSDILGVSLVLGWVLHFAIGILFGMGYGFIFAPKIHMHNICLKGTTYGILSLIIAQTSIFILNMLFQISLVHDIMPWQLIVMLVGHIVFGIVTAMLIEENNVLHAF
ncbi:DUF6789 family protein [Formosa algae]|uniref:DUF6789 family protein n=1 Tax=Formosa algae TaxID=225843 RepID=UPI000CCE2B56|nr:DUF6789 family protein [Formosa algae]PNW27058.1 hypothetical protein BKP44_14795 [Formosa algae]